MSEPGPDVPRTHDWWGEGLYVFIGSAVSILVIGLAAWATHEPWVFPSLGPTAYLLFAAPMSAQASPRNVICGHFIGIVAGVLAVFVFGLYGDGPNLDDPSAARVGAVTLALALTLGVMTWLHVPHAPAGATTLIVALGLLHTLQDYVVMMVAVVALVVVGYVINRIHGDRPPLWFPVAPSDR